METYVDREARDRLIGQASRIRTAARKLRTHLAALEEALTTFAAAPESTLSQAALQKELAASRQALDNKQLDTRKSQLEALLEGDFGLRRYTEDGSTIVEDLDELQTRWPASSDSGNPAAVSASVKASSTLLDEVILCSCRMTIPSEIEDDLELLRTGKAIDFHETLGDRLPDLKQRQQLLGELKNTKLGGWVDTASGLIYKLPPASWERLLCCVAPLLLAIVFAGLLFGIASIDLPAGFGTLDDIDQILIGYGLVLVGAIVHLALENVKQKQTGAVAILAITDTVYWLTLRWPALLGTVCTVLFVTVGLGISGLEPTEEGIALYASAGYSLDSVAGLFLTRFGAGAGAVMKKLEQRLNVAAGDAVAQGGGGGAAP